MIGWKRSWTQRTGQTQFSTKFAAKLSLMPPWSSVYFFPFFSKFCPLCDQTGFWCRLFFTSWIISSIGWSQSLFFYWWILYKDGFCFGYKDIYFCFDMFFMFFILRSFRYDIWAFMGLIVRDNFAWGFDSFFWDMGTYHSWSCSSIGIMLVCCIMTIDFRQTSWRHSTHRD